MVLLEDISERHVSPAKVMTLGIHLQDLCSSGCAWRRPSSGVN